MKDTKDTTMDDEIEIYEGQKADSRKPYVRINGDGRWYVNSSLSRAMGEKTKFVCIGASRDRARLYVWPSAGQGCEFSCKREKGGFSFTARSALCFWGLREKAVGKHPARWNAEKGRVEIDLTSDSPSSGPIPPLPAEPSNSCPPPGDVAGPPEQAASVAEQRKVEARPAAMSAGSCGDCAFGTRIRGCERLLCDCQASAAPFSKKLVTLRGCCSFYRARTAVEPDRHVQAGVVDKPHRQGSRPRAICPECGHNLSVTGKGLVPHDEDGVQYTGGRGDHERRCPGSNRVP